MFDLLCIDHDDRLRAYCITAQITYRDYLQITQSSEENLKIQRLIIKDTKAYQTLRADLRRGCVLPPIVLALDGLQLPASLSPASVEASRQTPGHPALSEVRNVIEQAVGNATIYIIDGLQRTNALRQTRDDMQTTPEEQASFLGRRLRVELWVGIRFGAIAYRMLLLNAGLKPMSIKHQIEILSAKLSDELSSIPGIEIFKTNEPRRRVQSGQFSLAKLAQAFQAWLQGQPSIDTRNAVMEQLLAESAIDTLGNSLAGPITTADRDSFKRLVAWFVAIDRTIPDNYREFLGSDTVLQGIAAAVGSAERKDLLRDRMTAGLERLRTEAVGENAVTVLALETFDKLRVGFDVAKVNVGTATREMVFHAFQEYFFSGGEKEMRTCWEYAASRS